MKPTIFIGSSTEGKPYAEAVLRGLSAIGDCHLWSQGVFEPGGTIQSSLLSTIAKSDFVVIVLTPDDSTIVRGELHLTPRDNLIFEAGLGFGLVHPTRTLLIPAHNSALKNPSDLGGFNFVDAFEMNATDPDIALAGAVSQVRKRVQSMGRRQTLQMSGGKEELAKSAIDLISSATRNVVMFGRDLSWAEFYVPAIADRKKNGVSIEVFSDLASKDAAKLNAAKLTGAGAKVYYCKIDPGIKLTLIDHHEDKVSRFMISYKERLNMSARPYGNNGDNFAYIYEIHDATASPLLWKSLLRLHISLKNEASPSKDRRIQKRISRQISRR
ncbi:MAG: nucleotide-binding protein [Acidobacteria bacterium]|nr:nucleotide-binding protein [Acidobacteriota bacterium]